MLNCFKIKHRASAVLVSTMIAAVVAAMVGLATVKLSSITLDSTQAIQIAAQAEQYAKSQASLLRAKDYSKLVGVSKVAIADGGKSSGFSYSVNLGSETEEKDEETGKVILKRSANVEVFHSSQTKPVYELKVPLDNSEGKSGSDDGDGIKVVDFYYDSATGKWYKEWSNGWLEQGGTGIVSWDASTATNLLKSYKSGDDYKVVATLYSVPKLFTDADKRNTNQSEILVMKQTGSSFNLRGATSDGAGGLGNLGYATWYACGKGTNWKD